MRDGKLAYFNSDVITGRVETMSTGSLTGRFLGVVMLVGAASTANAADDWAGQMVETKKVDFGVIATGSEARKYVQVKNMEYNLLMPSFIVSLNYELRNL